MKTYNYYIDPGHGWMRVKLDEIAELDLTNKISSYSYENGAWAYLEEDCDMTQFIDAYQQRYGMQPIIKTVHAKRDSKIRSYDRYTA